MTQDEQHLNQLSTFHYVYAGIVAFFSMLTAIYLLFVLFVVLAPHNFGNADEAPEWLSWLIAYVAVVAFVFGVARAILVFLAARFLAKRQCYYYCLVIAFIECLSFPLGTILGIFTILVLFRESVKQCFGQNNLNQQFLHAD